MAAWGVGAVTACMDEGLYVPYCIEFCRLRIRRGGGKERKQKQNMLISMKYRKLTHFYCEWRKTTTGTRIPTTKTIKTVFVWLVVVHLIPIVVPKSVSE